jgi:hypothetical protein
LKKKTFIIHLLIGVTLLSIPIISSPDFDKGLALFTVVPFLRNFLSYFLLVNFLFLHYYVIVPNFYIKKKWVLYSLVIVLSGVVVSYAPIWIIDLEEEMSRHVSPGHLERSNGFFSFFNIRNALIFQFFMVWILSLLLRLENQLTEIKNEKLITEVSYLKAQINPHFLFNTLNNIYSLTLTNSKKAPQAVLKLADMMRYIVSESSVDKVALKKELQYIGDYIDLQKLRMGEQVSLSFDVIGNSDGKQIAPIILIAYIENAFKYGVSPEVSSEIDVKITIKKDTIQLYVKNDIVAVEKLKATTKEGLKNTKKRLDVLYKNKYQLNIEKKQHKFEVNLLIDIS